MCTGSWLSSRPELHCFFRGLGFLGGNIPSIISIICKSLAHNLGGPKIHRNDAGNVGDADSRSLGCLVWRVVCLEDRASQTDLLETNAFYIAKGPTFCLKRCSGFAVIKQHLQTPRFECPRVCFLFFSFEGELA